MSQFRLNAKKPKNNAGLPTAKTELYLLYVEDIISMPEVNDKGILSTSDIIIDSSRRFHILYQTPSSQVHSREIEGDVDSRGFKKKISGTHPGDSIEINEFVKNNINQGFVILVKSCNSDIKKIYGSKCNPLYFTGSFTDDSDKKGYELTFEQEFADDTPVIFYTGKVLVDEDALSPSDVEFSSMFVKLDGSNITQENKVFLKEKLDIGELPTNIAKIDEGEGDNKKNGNTYTKDQVNTELGKKLSKPTTTISSPTAVVKYVILVDEQGNTQRMLAEDLGKNSANSDLETTGNRTFTQKHTYTHATGGFPYYVTGLPDKSADTTFSRMRVQDAHGQEAWSNGKAVLESLMASLPSVKDARTGNYDLNFSSQIVYNPNTKQIAVSDRPQIVSNYNVPSNITINHNLNNHAINLVYNGGEPNIPDNIRQAMERVKQIEHLPYTLFKPSDLVISTMPKSEYPASIRDTYTIPNDIWEMPNNGEFQVKRTLPVPPEFADDKYYFDNKYYTLTNAQFNVELPSSKDWVIRIQTVSPIFNIANTMSFEPNIGNHKSSLDYDMITILHHTVIRFHPTGTRGGYGLSNWANSEVFFIKTGDIITIFIRSMLTGSIETAIIPYKDRYKYLTFKMSNNGLDKVVSPNQLGVGRKFINMGYWIQP